MRSFFHSLASPSELASRDLLVAALIVAILPSLLMNLPWAVFALGGLVNPSWANHAHFWHTIVSPMGEMQVQMSNSLDAPRTTMHRENSSWLFLWLGLTALVAFMLMLTMVVGAEHTENAGTSQQGSVSRSLLRRMAVAVGIGALFTGLLFGQAWNHLPAWMNPVLNEAFDFFLPMGTWDSMCPDTLGTAAPHARVCVPPGNEQALSTFYFVAYCLVISTWQMIIAQIGIIVFRGKVQARKNAKLA